MPNRTFTNNQNKNQSKPSTGASFATDEQISSNKFIPKNVSAPDESIVLSSKRTTFNTNEEFIPTGQSILGSDVDLVLNRNFSLSSATDEQGPVLNRDFNFNDVNVAPNFANVQTNVSNILTNFLSFGSTTPLINTLQDNILDNFENVTYNFKLMLAPEDTLINTILPTSNLYIIAQTGVTTTFSIKDVEIESIVGPNNRTKNTQATLFRVEILEPLGISLIDRLLEAGNTMGIQNIMNAPMILELTFKGFSSASGLPAEVNIAKRTWKLQLIDLQTTLDEGGSRYTLSFVSVNDYGFHRFSSASVIKQQISYSVENVGEFFDKLSYYLTLQDAILASSGDQTRNEYEFVVDPEMRSWVIGSHDSEPNAPSMFTDAGKRSIVLKPGHKIEDIVDNILATTKEANKYANPSSELEKMNSPQKGENVSKIINISCESRILGFNEKNNEYIRKFIYYVNLYDAFRALPDVPDNSGQESRLRYMLEDSLKKKYSYIFTGENTSVLNLGLDLNNLWRHATTYYTYAMHRVNNNDANFIVRTPKDIGKIDDLRGSEDGAFSSSNKFAPTNLASPNISTTDKNLQLDNIPTDTGPTQQSERFQLQQRLQKLQELRTPNTVALQETLASLDTADNIIPVEGNSSAFKLPGLNALPVNNIVSSLFSRIQNPVLPDENLIETLQITPNLNPLKNMFIRQTDPALDINRVNENVEETIDFSRSIFGIIANQMYSSTYSDLLQIDLEIRGDPYWIGETDSEVIYRLRNNQTRLPGNGIFANYLRGENSFFLTFKTPRNYNENTGFVELEESTTFMGIYNVIQITHMFSDGKFTQKLRAIRDINTDPKKLKAMLR